ncbi:hypothetical protein BT67DRAFT_52060 [Trichocladium antarcticum]|uniref:SH3 domain signaling protein n=1 Tax=Trichocladium antarcticum TaxID=1450529 RepID=A0AAN6UIS1_9PEZI|nr:hypothetical protein BT67DRAFT_52060 [Trichocladium antarcticum]
MQSMQRQIGKLWNRGPGDNAKVSVLLNDYEDADKVLAQIIDNAKLWKESWGNLVTSQLQIVTEYESLYDPIVGASDGLGRQATPTPPLQLERTFKLKTAYGDLMAELMAEMEMIEEHILKPATEARDCIAPIRKTIKKRENKRLDYEKLQDKAIKLQRKPGRTPKEDAAYAKAETEVTRAAEQEFAIADEHLRQTLPPIITASFDLVPPLLNNLVLIQNRLLGLYYTTLHGYCEESGFPSPPPPMEEVVAIWNAAAGPVRSEIETISFITRGKANYQAPTPGSLRDPARSATLPVNMNGPRRPSSGLISNPHPRTLRVPSKASLRPSSPAPDTHSTSPAPSYNKRPDYSHATDFTTATMLGGAAVQRSTAALSPGDTQHRGRDYFGTARVGRSSVSPSPSPSLLTSASASATASRLAAAKKKPPPPPPPPKRLPSTQPEEWVVAQYTFVGQGAGDLSFQDGDRIRVVKRTGTDQDWWAGELRGVRGNFPANYCKPL